MALAKALTTSLRTRVLLLVLAAFIAFCVPAYFAFTHIVSTSIATLGTLFAEKQILFDRYRGLDTLRREVSLAQTLARAPNLIEWSRNEDDPAIRARGLAELEHFREAFVDKSYFFVIDASGNYYFNDDQNTYADAPYRYTVTADNPRDGWYFTTRQRREGCYLNVDNDDVLRVTKVWMNCVVAEDGEVLGIVGTGIDLSAFIREVVDIPQTGVQAMFVDRSGAVQAHRDASLVDFHSLTKEIGDKSTVFELIDTDVGRATLRAMMNTVTFGASNVRSAFLPVGGQTMLVGVAYLDEIGWYNVTVMDVDAIIDKSLFLPIGILLATLLALLAALLTYIFKRSVIDRLVQIEQGVEAIEAGHELRVPHDMGRDEIGRLSAALSRMSQSVAHNRYNLERLVLERTEELETLANLDALTGISNRRGFATSFERAQKRLQENGGCNGLALIDIDHFKSINDSLGHQAGDSVVVEVARRLSSVIRQGDICARWGGDEFVVMLRDADATGLRQVTASLRDLLRARPVVLADGGTVRITVSIGACLIEVGDSLDTVTDLADAALYAAKDAGRNQVMVFDKSDRPAPDAEDLAS
jgi:diguanylate cyclase (GGDEF)-like protein